MRKPLVLHPFLFAAFPILFLFSHNVREVPSSQVVAPLVVAVSLALLLLLFSKLIFKDILKAAVFVSLFLILCFSYGHFYDLTKGSGFVRHRYLLPLWSILLISGALFIRRRRYLQSLTCVLNAMALFLIVIPLVNIGIYKFKTGFHKSTHETLGEATSSETGERATLPDIYYIIMDRYGSAEILKEMFDFDNSDFINYLQEKGFYVASKSRSNYPRSALSLASSLNMEYINYLADKVGENSDNTLPLDAMIEDNRVWRFLKSKGYKYIHFGSWWHPTSINRYADENVNLYPLPEFSMLIFKTTMFYPFAEKLQFLNDRQLQWRRVLYKFDKLAEVPSIKEPTFVFAHMLVPHEPFVFDKEGNYLTEEQARKMSKKEKFVNQLIFTNKKLRALIDKLLSASDPPPIIILQGDEGPYPENFKWVNANPVDIKHKFGILNVYFLPGVDKSILYPSITPVNTFRLVFNLYFGTNYELLPDESYIIADEKHIYKFTNVTALFK